ncbi:MAG: adenylate cyclase class 1 [Methylophagaceae bacterium]
MSIIDPVEARSVFQTLNRTKIARLSTLLPLKAHLFLEVLPLLFQTNDPLLPGYISQATPVGIVDYQPTNAALDAAKTLNHTFHFKRHSLRHYPLRGLYLINDNGLLNYHGEIQFELWLIYTQLITEEELKLLQQKITAICDWVYSFFQIKLNSRVLNEARFSEDITPFDLDRFYLSGLLLAGLPPSWWTLPPAAQDDPLNISRPHDNNILDFGTLTSKGESAQSLLNRAFATIDKAMDSDLDSCLTLIFQSARLQQYPDSPWLSDALKRAIYTGVIDPMLLDTSSLRLNYISQHCDDETSYIAQQSFYTLSRERLSKTVSLAPFPWRRAFINQLYLAWQWPENISKLIDTRGSSHYRQSLSECHKVRLQITNAMKTVFLFAQQHKFNIEVAKQKLEKKFKIIFDSDLDAIGCLPVAFKPQNSEEHLYLARTSTNSNWQINDLPAKLSTQPLYQHQSLLNVLTWAVNNQLLTKSTPLQLFDQKQQVKMARVLDLIQQLLNSTIKTRSSKINSSHFDKPAEINRILLFANLEHQTINPLNQQGLDIASLQADPLNYANSKQSLLTSVEGLIHSSWGHCHHITYTGPTSLLTLLSTVIQWQPQRHPALKATCWCPSDNHGKKISHRIETLYSEIIAHYSNHPLSGDYLIAIADQFYRLQWQQGLVDILPLVKNTSLEQHLAQERDIFSASNVDPLLDKDGLLRLLLNQQMATRISLFLLSKNNSVTLYIIDDLGTLFKQHSTGLTVATLISHYQQFFSTINIITDIQFFHLIHSTQSGWKNSKITNFNFSSNKTLYLPVRVELNSAKENAHCSIHCGPKTFTGNADDPNLFKQVSDLVLSLRNTTSRYPLYINQLSFTDGQTYTTRHYIMLKQQIEIRLNKAENLSL